MRFDLIADLDQSVLLKVFSVLPSPADHLAGLHGFVGLDVTHYKRCCAFWPNVFVSRHKIAFFLIPNEFTALHFAAEILS